jgi:hypothetical protein
MRLLGIDSFVTYSNDYYLRQGAGFFVTACLQALNMALLPLGILALTVAAVWIGARRFAPVKAVEHLQLLRTKHPWILKGALVVAYAIPAIYLIDRLDMAMIPLSLSNILFSADPPKDPALAKLHGQVLACSPALGSYWRSCALWPAIGAGILFILVRMSAPRRRFRGFVVFPFALLLLLYGFLLPATFGVLVSKKEFHPISVVTLEKTVPDGKYFLLSDNEQGFTLWNQQRRSVFWLRRDRIVAAEIGPREQPLQEGRLGPAGTK